MNTTFFFEQHKVRFGEFLKKDNTAPQDVERIALFYLMAGNDDLYAKASHIYDFEEHGIRNCLANGRIDFSSGARSLIRLGFNLYNGYEDDKTTPLYLLCNLDCHNQHLALNAMAIRFKIS